MIKENIRIGQSDGELELREVEEIYEYGQYEVNCDGLGFFTKEEDGQRYNLYHVNVVREITRDGLNLVLVGASSLLFIFSFISTFWS